MHGVHPKPKAKPIVYGNKIFFDFFASNLFSKFKKLMLINPINCSEKTIIITPAIILKVSEFCNNVWPKKVELYMFGAEKRVFFENEDGLDGIAIMRGIAKDQAMDGSHSQSFQTLTVLHLRDDCGMVDVAKYTWPYNEFEQKESERILTTENLQNMIFKNDSEKRQHEKVKEYLDWELV